jgi:hypothetical protein
MLKWQHDPRTIWTFNGYIALSRFGAQLLTLADIVHSHPIKHLTQKEALMLPATSAQRFGPRRNPYGKSVDQPAKLIENEPRDVERDTPREDNESVEQAVDKNRSNSPSFEE